MSESAAPLAVLFPAHVHPGEAGIGAEGDDLGIRRVQVALQTVFFLRQHHDGAALRRFVGHRCDQGDLGQFLFGMAVHRDKGHRLPIAQGDGAGLVEQHDVDVAGGLDGPAGQGDDVFLKEPVHPGDADGGQQGGDRGRGQTDEEGHQDGQRDRLADPVALTL